MASKELIEAIAVTAELCGRVFSEAAARVFVADLSGYDEREVVGALSRCRREVKGLLTIGDVISRLDDGRPGAEEAWAMCPKSESESVILTQEMGTAYGIASSLIDSGDLVQARMAFLEKYRSEVSRNREQRLKVEWFPSLGTNKAGRESALLDAVRLGRISEKHARSVCGEIDMDSLAIASKESLPLGFTKAMP